MIQQYRASVFGEFSDSVSLDISKNAGCFFFLNTFFYLILNLFPHAAIILIDIYDIYTLVKIFQITRREKMCVFGVKG